MIELKKCPFCGGEAEIRFSWKKTYGMYAWTGYVVAGCTCCTASVRGKYYAGHEIKIPLCETEDGIIAAMRWNNRNG